jgi:cyclopropane fatty-acyl-phospholipid synthase-like methyltransferase
MDRESELNQLFVSEGPSFGSDPTPHLLEAIRACGISGAAIDLGSGDGRDTLHLAALGFRVRAIDLSNVALRKLSKAAVAKGFADLIETEYADLARLQCATATYDLAISITSIDHLREVEARHAFRQMTGALRVGGLLFVRVHTKDDPGFCGGEGQSETKAVLRHYFGRGELLALLPDSFELIRYIEEREEDLDHGPRHNHYFATLIGIRRT